MQKTRIMPTLLYKDTTLVKGESFDSWRRVGSLIQAIKVYNMREVDELVFLDIRATKNNRSPDFDLVDDFADDCFMPLTVGGGITSTEDVRKLLLVGADKVSVNSSAIENKSLVTDISRKFGAQCVVVSIDYKTINGQPIVYTHSGTKNTGINAYSWASEVESLGAGEILLTSIEHDGLMSGYDFEVLKKVSKKLTIPVIASGGAGNYEDMYKALNDCSANAVAAASIFHFTSQTPLQAKKYLYDKGIKVRL